jgi:hypothetical protein
MAVHAGETGAGGVLLGDPVRAAGVALDLEPDRPARRLHRHPREPRRDPIRRRRRDGGPARRGLDRSAPPSSHPHLSRRPRAATAAKPDVDVFTTGWTRVRPVNSSARRMADTAGHGAPTAGLRSDEHATIVMADLSASTSPVPHAARQRGLPEHHLDLSRHRPSPSPSSSRRRRGRSRREPVAGLSLTWVPPWSTAPAGR